MKSFLFYLDFFTYLINLNFKKNKFEKLKASADNEQVNKCLHGILTTWSSRVLNYVNADIEVIGKENIPEEACLYVANHQGYFDIPIIVHSLDRIIGFIAKKEILKFKVLTYWMEQIHCVFMDRSNVRESIKAINKGVETLKNGHSLVIFPEGTRSKGPRVGEFKKGSLKLALKSGVPIVPVAIDGSYKLREGNKANSIKPAKVKVTICKPIYLEDLSKEDQSNLSQIVKDVIKDKIYIEQ